MALSCRAISRAVYCTNTGVVEPDYTGEIHLTERVVRTELLTPLNTIKPMWISSDVLALVLALNWRI